VITFLKTSEEATCLNSFTCDWRYTNDIPSVTSVSPAFDSTLQEWTLRVSGSNLPNVTDGTSLIVNGLSQPIVTTSDTQAVFKVTDVSSNVFSISQLYFPAGRPEGADTVVATTRITLEPRMLPLSPNAGSIAGTRIVALVPGVGSANAKDFNLIDANSQPICQSVQIPEYGKVICNTFARAMNTTTISAKLGTTTYTCAASSETSCQFGQTEGDSTIPRFTSVTKSSATDLSISGTGLGLAGYSVKVNYSGIVSDNFVAAADGSSLTVSWN